MWQWWWGFWSFTEISNVDWVVGDAITNNWTVGDAVTNEWSLSDDARA